MQDRPVGFKGTVAGRWIVVERRGHGCALCEGSVPDGRRWLLSDLAFQFGQAKVRWFRTGSILRGRLNGLLEPCRR